MLRQPLEQEAPASRRDALEQDLADEVVAEAEAEPVDAEEPPLAEPLELLEELGRVDSEEVRERLGIEGLLEQRGSGQEPVGPLALGATLGEERVREGARAFGPV